MYVQAVPERPDLSLKERLETYAAWVRDLRHGAVPSPLVTDALDPLADLGRELELLSAAITCRETELKKLFDVVQTVGRGVLLDDVLSKIFEGFRGVIPFERIGCAFLSDGDSRVVSYWARSTLGPIQLPSDYEQPLAGSSLATILATGQPRVINDLEAYLAGKPASTATRLIVAEGGRASLTCPLILEGRPLGFLFFTSGRVDAYRDTHQSVFRQIASQVALVIEKSRLYEQLIEHNRTLLTKNRRLEVVATRDALTGVLNRRAIEALLQRLFVQRRTGARACGVIMADIDHFKTINDTYGHAVGDQALKQFVRRLAAGTRKTDTIGRSGGDEFLIVVEDATEEQLLDTAERLRRSVGAAPSDLDGNVVTVTASFGAAHMDSTTRSWMDLVRQADHALYRAKAQGRDCCVLAQTPGVSLD